MLADKVDHIIGVDTHKDSHTIAVVSPAGAVIAHRRVPATPVGYLYGYRFAVEHAPSRRVWATWGHRQLRGRAHRLPVPAGPMGGRDRPSRPPGAPQRRQDR
jgi:hypothetical protein